MLDSTYYLKNNKKKLIVFFSSYTTKKGKFDFWKIGQDLSQEADILFLADYSKSWYLKEIEKIESFLKNIILSYASTNIYFIGGSMGAYGALLFGTKLNVNIVSFGSDMILKAPFSQSSRRLTINVPNKYKHVLSFFKDYTAKAFIYTGELDHSDLCYTNLIPNTEDIIVKIIKNCFHSIPIYLNSLQILESFILEIIQKNKSPNYPFITTYSKLNLNHKTIKKILEAKNDLNTLLELDKSYLSYFYVGFNLYKDKNYKKAIKLKSLNMNKNNIQTLLFLGMSLREMNQCTQALIIFKSIENNSFVEYSRMNFEIALLYKKMGDDINAIYYLYKSISEDYNTEKSLLLLKLLSNNLLKGQE